MNFALVSLVLLIAGCATRRSIEIAPIKIDINMDLTGRSHPEELKPNPFWEALAKKAIGEESVIGQITLGCLSYREASGRWPQTKEELAEGLTTEKFPADRLSEVQTITFREDHGILWVEFAASGKIPSSGTLRLDPNKKEYPHEPTPTKDARPDQSAAVPLPSP